ncbi:MAG: hypothetical protein ACFFCS_03065 [Candidatus Hodarchaeota archaeon]
MAKKSSTTKKTTSSSKSTKTATKKTTTSKKSTNKDTETEKLTVKGTATKKPAKKTTSTTKSTKTTAKKATVKDAETKKVTVKGTEDKKPAKKTTKKSSDKPEKKETKPRKQKDEGEIKERSIASFMRKRTQLVGFDFGHFKHVQYAVEFLDNALDAIESFNWKTEDTDDAYQLESEVFQSWIDIEEELMEATSEEVQGLSSDLSSAFSSMGDGNGDVASYETSATTPAPPPSESAPVEVEAEPASKVKKKTDADIKAAAIIDAMNDLINPYIDLVLNEPIVIIKLNEVEEKSLVMDDKSRLYCFEIFDSGSGMQPPDLEKFGKYLASSKSEKLKQTRGSQGFGSPSAFSDAQNTTGKPIDVITKHYKSEKAHVTEFFTTGENTKSYSVEPKPLEDVNFSHGTYIRLFYTNIKYVRGYVDAYVKQTALMNSHVSIVFNDPYGDKHFYPRLVNEFPEEPKYAKPHPSSINIGEFQDMLRTSGASTIKQFLTTSFIRISGKLASRIVDNTENELQDLTGLIKLNDKEYITIKEKKNDYVYLLREENRVFGKSERPRPKWIVYLLKVGEDEAVEAYDELYKKYTKILSDIKKEMGEIKNLEKKRDAASTKKEEKEIGKNIKVFEKRIEDAEKLKNAAKKEFSVYVQKFIKSYEEFTNRETKKVITEKFDIVNFAKTKPQEVHELQINTFFKYFTMEKYLSPPTDTAIPVSSDVLESTLLQEFNLNVSKFDQYFDEEAILKTIQNDSIDLPKKQDELKKTLSDDLDEESRLYHLLQLDEKEFTNRMATGPIHKFLPIVARVNPDFYNDLKKYDKALFKKHELINEEIVEEDLDFVSAVTRPPTSGKGLAFIVEAAIAYGNNVKSAAKASDVVYRFVNRTPKLRDNSDCAIWKTVQMVNWKNYMIDTFDNSIPKGSLRVFVNVSGPFVHLMFKSQSKQALAEDDNLTKEIKLALEQVGRKIRLYLSRRQKHADKKKRASRFIKFAPIVARSVHNILSRSPLLKEKLVPPEDLEEKMVEVIGLKAPTPPAKEVKRIQPSLPAKKIEKPAEKLEEKAKEVEKPAEKVPIKKEIPKQTVQQQLVPIKKKESVKPAVKVTRKPTAKTAPAPAKKETTPPKATGPIKISEANILKYLPADRWVKISYLIKALNIKDITDARFLEIKLRTLTKQGRIEKIVQEGKSRYKKV